VTAIVAAGMTVNVSAAQFQGAANVVCNEQTGLIIWDVTQNMDESWHYDYFFQATGNISGIPENLPLIGQFCIQVPTTFTGGDILDLTPQSRFTGIGPVTPTCGSLFFGACFVPIDPFAQSDTASSNIHVVFDCPFAPTLGHFWVDLVPGDTESGTPAAEPGEFIDMGMLCIPTPGNGELPVIPEPLTMLVLSGALAPLAIHLRRRVRHRLW